MFHFIQPKMSFSGSIKLPIVVNIYDASGRVAIAHMEDVMETVATSTVRKGIISKVKTWDWNPP